MEGRRSVTADESDCMDLPHLGIWAYSEAARSFRDKCIPGSHAVTMLHMHSTLDNSNSVRLL
jgi:hypothetical protein